MAEINPFKKLEHPRKEVPKDLKKKVMNDISSVKLLIDIATLFTSNYKHTIVTTFKTKNKTKSHN